MIRRLVLFGLPVLVAVGASFGPALADAVLRNEQEPAPVAVSSDDVAPFTTVADLVAASDAVVLAEVLETVEGRVLTDPAAPDAGVRTRLADLRVVEVLAGAAPQRLVLEEVATLLDGTPVRVDGASAVAAGERGVFFLVAGRTESAPHWGVVGAQGRYLVRGDTLESGASDPLSGAIVEAGGPALVDAVAAVSP